MAKRKVGAAKKAATKTAARRPAKRVAVKRSKRQARPVRRIVHQPPPVVTDDSQAEHVETPDVVQGEE
jgi:hypothetical protein